jgi:hypothetical protein
MIPEPLFVAVDVDYREHGAVAAGLWLNIDAKDLLLEALKGQNKTSEAEKIRKRYEK